VTVPHSRHVSVTASAIASLHELAPGRVVLGLGTGGSSAQTMGLSLAQVGRAATLEAMATALRGLLAGKRVRFETGIDGRLAWLERPPAIPLYLAGSGPRMLETAGRLGDGAIVYATVQPAVLTAALARVAAGAKTSGRELGELDVALWAPMSVGRDGALARDHARGRVASACRHPLPVRLAEEDEAAMRRVRRRMTHTSTRRRAPAIARSCPIASSTSWRSPARPRRCASASASAGAASTSRLCSGRRHSGGWTACARCARPSPPWRGDSGMLGIETREGVRTLTLRRPDKRNALSIELRHALADALRSSAEDPAVGAGILTGEGRGFCAGMDMTQFGGDAGNRTRLVESTEAMIGALVEHPKPLVAAVNGPARGGGFAVALLCDLRIAGAAASFGFSEVRLGIPPSYGAARAALPRGLAHDLCLTGRTVSAEEALAHGIVSEVLADDELARRAQAVARELASAARAATVQVKAWARAEARESWLRLLELERQAFRAAVLGD
jgi:2-(1,2-epoxy-1,2-dihydrophenyl)acetyl-CoA isomerase